MPRAILSIDTLLLERILHLQPTTRIVGVQPTLGMRVFLIVEDDTFPEHEQASDGVVPFVDVMLKKNQPIEFVGYKFNGGYVLEVPSERR